jgi:putative nucleotidyltransferase with HDIG domain
MSTVVRSRAEQLVSGTVKLASPPLIYSKLMQVLDDPRAGSTDLGNVISEDQGLAARVLAVVNSALFALPWRVESISAAVRVVGTSQIRDLAIATSVLSLFDDVPDDLLDVDGFRNHSLACGVAARVLAGQRGEDNVERFFVAGLLHDVGRLILTANAPAEMRTALEASRSTDRDLRSCEREVIGCSHEQVGGVLLEKWRFPDSLREAVRHHHDPTRASRFPVEAAAVHVADAMAHALHWGRSGQPRVPRFEPHAWVVLGLDVDLTPIIVDEAEHQLEAALNLIPSRDGS